MKVWKSFFGSVIIICLLSGCAEQQSPPNPESIKNIVSSILNRQMEGWNQGSIEEYMSGYYQSDSLRFAANGSVTYGWQLVLERYKNRFQDKATMGTLTFSDVDIKILSRDVALAFGKWKLKQGEDEQWGLFTLLFKKTAQGWRVIHDHTSTVAEN